MILKCKMCGASLNVESGQTVCQCEYCFSKQTIPNLNDEKKNKLYERANKLRFNSEFDKAYFVYQEITNIFSDDAEAYWGLLLCKYGIEYVEDPISHNRIPVSHRSSFESIMDNYDFEMVMENSDSISRQVYREEAKKIEEIRKRIIEVSSKEKPYDIFICYKENDLEGNRTIDSVIAQDVYTELVNKGYSVFFSRVTLEDKLGEEYEPYIFAALNSAKLMLVFGTCYDYFNAVWVKNEWSRYLQLMSNDNNKHLIPCYKNIDAYDMPKEFAKLQAQDMSKVGANQDLIRGIEKILGNTNNDNYSKILVQQTNNIKIDAMLRRGYDALEDGAYNEAKGCFDEILNNNAMSAEAYLGLLMADKKIKNFEYFKDKYIHEENADFQESRYWKRAKQYATGKFAEELCDLEKTKILLKKNEEEAINKKLEKEAEDIANKKKRIQFLSKQFDEENLELSKEEKNEQEHSIYLLRDSEIALVKAERPLLDGSKKEKLKKLIEIINLEQSIGINNHRLYFGKYKQTDRIEPIEWQVLDKQDNKVLIISKHILDCQPYNSDFNDSNWESCTLRQWLNNVFIMDAFAFDEQLMIQNVNFCEDNNSTYNDTIQNCADKLFLLSIDETNRFFLDNESRKCTVTNYAKSQGVYTSNSYSKNGMPTGWWWMRSTGCNRRYAACVYIDGTIRSWGIDVDCNSGGIRPAMWINLDS